MELYRHSPYEKLVTIGSLKGSTRSTNLEALSDAIYEDTGIQVELRFRPIPDGKQQQDPEKIVRAVHIDIPTY